MYNYMEQVIVREYKMYNFQAWTFLLLFVFVVVVVLLILLLLFCLLVSGVGDCSLAENL